MTKNIDQLMEDLLAKEKNNELTSGDQFKLNSIRKLEEEIHRETGWRWQAIKRLLLHEGCKEDKHLDSFYVTGQIAYHTCKVCGESWEVSLEDVDAY